MAQSVLDDASNQLCILLNFFAHHQITHAFVPTVLVADIVSAPQPSLQV
ncbi:hypothetical protein [Serratia proteamaculans]|jgi:hypothetical protein|nr:hypothetical protein [Serratia proteamaculans]SPZ53099.1 Uncharacterised protein [Serratia quinivorans]NWA73043.1 hypothetical protein [Serratia proteamaculans]CAI0938982.1 Uncharacterised protein [Serratia proteamaculans]CAI1000267.1 Uncharacterised protein [Serratia proteamaculans]CAI1013546.1 Uncharacterised protein [Serratia proteamaculans]